MAARRLGHEYLVLTDHSPRLTVANGCRPSGCAAARRRRRGQRRRPLRRTTVPPAHRHRGRHPRGRHARPEPTSCSSGSTSSWRACTRSCGWPRRDDPPDGRRDRATRTPTCSATAPAGWSRAAAAPGRPVGVRRRAGLRGVRAVRRRGRDQLPSRAARPAEAAARAGDRGRVPVLDRHRRARAGPARLAAQRLRAGGRAAVSTPDRIVNTRDVDGLLAWTADHGALP